MSLKRILSGTVAGLAAGIVLSATAVAQPWVAIGAGGIQNPNLGGNVAINIAPVPGIPPLPVACDPLHVGSQGAPAALRLSDGPVPVGACACGFGRLGYEPAGGGVFAPGISTQGDLVLVTGGAPLGASCSEDVVIATAGRRIGKIRFATQNPPPAVAALVERMTIMNGTGFVGINTTAPTQPLDVNGNVNFTGNLFVNGLTGGVGTVLGIDAFGNTAWISPSGTGDWNYNGNTVGMTRSIGTIDNYDFPIIANNNEVMRATVAGNVGIGTTAPSQMLEVNGNTKINGNLIFGSVGGQVQDGSGSVGSPGDIFQNDGGGNPRWASASSVITGTAWGLQGNSGTSALCGGGTDYVGTADNTDLTLGTNASSVMAIGGGASNQGNVLIAGAGTGIPGNTYRLEVIGDSRFGGNVLVAGTFTVSDARLKENVATLNNAMSRINALRGVSYTFNGTAPARMGLPKTPQIGFIAQEVQQVVPEAVGTTSEGYLSVNYPELIPILVEGMKEQQHTIQTQQAQIDALTARLSQIERQLGTPVKVPEKPEGGSNLRVR